MVIAAMGLAREAALVERHGVQALACGGSAVALRTALTAAIARERPRGLISIGIAGGLDPSLPVGAIVIGNMVGRTPTDAAWAARLMAALPAARHGLVAGVDFAVFDAAAKAAMFLAGGPLAVDMESHVVAEAAVAHGLPFAILRAVSDTAADTLPYAARVPLGLDGKPRLPQILAEVARRPWQIPALIHLAGNTNLALKALGVAMKAAGPDLAAP
jgi:hopanoid-associated phosphorylase